VNPYYADSPVVETVTGGQWNTLTYWISTTDPGYADATTVDAYGIELMQNGAADVSDTIYIDDIIVQ
jgi:hypothetical protein